MKYNFKPEKMGRWIIRRKWFVISIMFLVALVAASGMRHLRINNDYHEFFSDENPQLKAYDALQQKYTKDDNVYIMLQPKNGNVFTKETLQAIENLVDRAWKTPYSSRVDAITNFQKVSANEDNLFIDALVKDPSKLQRDDLLKIKEQALSEPLLVNRLIDTTGSFTAVNITVNLPGKSLTENNEVAKYVRKLVDDWKKDYPHINAYLTGNVIFIEAFDDNFAKDMSQLTPLMFLVIVVLLLIATKNAWSTIGAFLVVLLSMFSGLGVAGWLGFKLSGPVFSAPNMIITLAIADSVICRRLLSFNKKRFIYGNWLFSFFSKLSCHAYTNGMNKEALSKWSAVSASDTKRGNCTRFLNHPGLQECYIEKLNRTKTYYMHSNPCKDVWNLAAREIKYKGSSTVLSYSRAVGI